MRLKFTAQFSLEKNLSFQLPQHEGGYSRGGRNIEGQNKWGKVMRKKYDQRILDFS